MDPIVFARTLTEKYLDYVNFSELNSSWVEEVIDCEFTDVSEYDISIELLFQNDAVITLNKLSEACSAWTENSNENESDVSFNASTNDSFWKVLDEMEINVKHMQSLIYLLCHRSTKIDSSIKDIEIGLASANWYYNCLKIPGSAAYSVYHPQLFHICITSLPVPDFTVDKGAINLKDFEKLLSLYRSNLTSLIHVLSGFHLGNNSNTVEHVIKKLVELSACEVQSQINFNINIMNLEEHELRRRYKPCYIVSYLTFHALSALVESDLNGDRVNNYSYVLAFLNRHVLCLKTKKNQTISQKYHVIKDNAIEFMLYNLKNKDFSSEVTLSAVKRLCLAVSDKADFRSAVSQAVTTLMSHMEIDHLSEMVQWLLMLVDSADVKDRMIALEIFDQILANPLQVDSGNLPDDKKVYLTEMPLIFSVLTRCDDTSSNVRTKALTVLSQNMRCILNFLESTKDQGKFSIENEDELDDRDISFNGNHRYFWYDLPSLRDRLNEIASILHRRIDDRNGVARKATLQALENLIVFDLTYLTLENLKFFDFASKDTNIVVKKQVIQSLSSVLQIYHDKSLAQEWWIKCILPLIQDPENSVQSKVLSVIEEQFLVKLLSSNKEERECSFSLLKFLSSGDFSFYQRYFRKAFRMWKSEKKLRSQTIGQLDKYINSEFEECFWFYLSNFAKYSTLPINIIKLAVKKFEEICNDGTYPVYFGYILSVLLNVFTSAPHENLLLIQNTLSSKLESDEVPLEYTPLFIELLNKIHNHMKTGDEFAQFSSQLMKKCLNDLSNFSRSSLRTSDCALIKCFCIIKELCQISPALITKNMLTILKKFCRNDGQNIYFLPPRIRAHAFAALGKICLQEETLAKDLLPMFARELLKSQHDVLRNNAVIILIDMCKRYTSFADKYVPLICTCFKDELYVIRYQAIALIINLIQEDFVKWKGSLFFCLVYTTIDKKENIQELAKFCLVDVMRQKRLSVFADHFVDSIFVFNNYPPPDNPALTQTVRNLDRFAIKGNDSREKRMILYKFMLDNAQSSEKSGLMRSILNILSNVADGIYPLDEHAEIIIKDCFAIINCKEIRVFNNEMASEDIEEDKLEVLRNTEFETQKLVLTECVIPTVINLRNATRTHFSHLSEDIIIFLKEALEEYKEDAKNMLESDKLLQKEVMAVISRDALRNEREAKEKNKTIRKSPSKPDAEIDINDFASTSKNISHFLLQEKDKVNDTAGPSSAQPEELLPQQLTIKLPDILNCTLRNSAEPALSAEAFKRLASTPRVSLVRLKTRPSNVLNISAIEKESEPMTIDDPDE